jgi:hypothetical protein
VSLLVVVIVAAAILPIAFSWRVRFAIYLLLKRLVRGLNGAGGKRQGQGGKTVGTRW